MNGFRYRAFLNNNGFVFASFYIQRLASTLSVMKKVKKKKGEEMKNRDGPKGGNGE